MYLGLPGLGIGQALGRPSSNLTATTMALTSSVNPTTAGNSTTFTGTVSTVSGTPTGTVSFYDNGVIIPGGANKPLSGLSATFAYSGLSTGSHTITAVYSGDTTYAPSASPGLTQTVNAGGADTTTGLVSYWAFSETSGTNVADTATPPAQAAVATIGSSGGWVAPGFRCNGVDTYVTAVDNAAYNPGTAFTVFTWIFAPNGVGGFILSQFDNLANDRSWIIGTDTTTGQFLRVVLSNDGTNTNLKDYVDTTIDLTLGGWRSVAFSFGPSSTLKIYVDGVNKTSVATKTRDDTFTLSSGAMRNSATRICWGGLWAGGGLTNAYLVDVQRTRIYNVVKTDADIAAIHALGHA